MSRFDSGSQESGVSGGTQKALRTLLLTGAAVGAAALANAYIFYRTPPLVSLLPGESLYFPAPEGDIFYKKLGSGPPLLLVHGIGAGCSSLEWRNVIGPLAEKYTVYALDLPGFGKSDRPAINYSPEFFIESLERFCRDVLGVGDGRGEADVIATSLSAAYVIALSQKDGSLFRRLVLVCPTGYEALAAPKTAAQDAAYAALKTPVLGTSIYNTIASRAAMREYLTRRIYHDPAAVTEETLTYFHTAAHQPGADRVLPAFASGRLNLDISSLFPRIEDLPLIVWGRHAKETPLGQVAPFIESNPHAKLEVIEDAGMLPHDERPEAFLAAVRPFLAAAEEVPSLPPPSEGVKSGRARKKKEDRPA